MLYERNLDIQKFRHLWDILKFRHLWNLAWSLLILNLNRQIRQTVEGVNDSWAM
jgi:hypothetical protein